MWAVVDRQWWLRWQRFTGCHESQPGCGGEGQDSGGDRRDNGGSDARGGDMGDYVKGCNENTLECDVNGDGVGGGGAREMTDRGLALGAGEEPRAENGGSQENGEKENEEENGEKEVEEKVDTENVKVGEKLEETKCEDEKQEQIDYWDLGGNEAENAKENEKATKNQEQEKEMGEETKEGSAAAGGGTPERGGDRIPESGEKKEKKKPSTADGRSSDGDGCRASEPGSKKTGDQSEEVVPVASGKEETKNIEGGVGDGDTVVAAPGSSGETEVASLREERGSVRTGRRQMAIEVANGGEHGPTVFFNSCLNI